MAARVRALIILFFLLSSQTLLSAEYRVKGICFAKEFPARDAMILFVLEPGMQVTAIRENNEWIYVTSPQNSGSRGWVLKEALLRKSTETAAVIKPDSIGIIKPTATLPVINENEKPHPTEGHQDKKTAQKRPAVALTLIIVLLLVILYPIYSIFQILKQNKRLKQSRQPQTQPPEPQLTKTSVATDTGPTKPSPPKPSSPHISPNAVKTAGEIPAPAPTTSAPGPSKSLPNVIVTPPPSKRQSSNGTKGPVIASGEILKPAPAASAPGPSKPLPNVTITPPPSKRPTPSTSTSSVTPTKGTRIQTPPGSAPVPPAPIPTSKRTPPPPEPPKPRLDGVIEINEDFQRALDLMEKTNRCLFITGKAGTGKSTLLKLFVKSTKKQVALLAPTGIAALNIGGRTLHSFFKFPPRMITEDDIKESHDKALYRSFDTIIIDEISMVRTDMLDSVDKFLRKNGRDQNKPFGGIQLIFFGDLFQLSPIAKKDELAYLKDNYGGGLLFPCTCNKNCKAFDNPTSKSLSSKR